ncbi:hypothetical protein BCU68_11030 [Vibrio sp. 10N.286.49.B3]|uniref:glycine zipper 2TM domain-containing protein n=1 Tax=Vibrio sp. 10N.286.49.B3 TaxID=1880855 RepID=UPI000C85BE2E|nr:glycine zipper 2TM domain-containing protein [Vibrio sp. 10N.286.49.B3]PMH44970.1 hypothetical protein BCU68_11030 [Vibrio sp. 10N.286.49.B3]
MQKWLWIILFFPMLANAAYQRNTARPVNEVVYGQVEVVRYITQQEIKQSHANGWETLLGGVIGGLIGNQFGGGTGKQVATAVGAIAGASAARQYGNQITTIQYRLVELLIKTNKGKVIDVIQDFDSSMRFNEGDDVRILYFDDGVRVDIAY